MATLSLGKFASSFNNVTSGSTPGTTPAAAGGMFGSTQASKPLFGAAPTTTAPQTGGLFGGTTGTASGGLFGNTASSAPAASGGLFGAMTSQPQTSGLFGASTATSQPQAGGLFGGSAAATSQPQTGGLFGNSTATTTSQPQGQIGGGLFGAPAQAQNHNTGGSMFGASQQTQNQSGGGGLFGGGGGARPTLFGGLGTSQNQNQLSQNQNQNQNTMFGNLQQPSQNASYAPTGSFVGGLTMGAANQQNTQQRVPGVYVDKENLRLTTRFDDLHEDLKKQIEYMDNLVQVQIARKGECDAIMPAHGESLLRMPKDVEFCRRKLIGVETALTTDVESIAHVQQLVQTDADNAKLSFKSVDRLKLPPQFHTPGVWHIKSTNAGGGSDGSGEEARDIVGYFSATANEMDATLRKYQNNMQEIEAHLRNVEATTAQQVNSLVARRNGAAASDGNAVGELAGVLGDFQQGVLQVAGTIGAAREGIQALQIGSFTGPGSRSALFDGKRSGVY